MQFLRPFISNYVYQLARPTYQVKALAS